MTAGRESSILGILEPSHFVMKDFFLNLTDTYLNMHKLPTYWLSFMCNCVWAYEGGRNATSLYCVFLLTLITNSSVLLLDLPLTALGPSFRTPHFASFWPCLYPSQGISGAKSAAFYNPEFSARWPQASFEDLFQGFIPLRAAPNVKGLENSYLTFHVFMKVYCRYIF